MDKAKAKVAIRMIDDVLQKHGISGPEDLKKLRESIVSEQSANEQITLLMRIRKLGLDLVGLLWSKLSSRMERPFKIIGKVGVDFPKKQYVEGKVSIENLANLEKLVSSLYRELERIRQFIKGKNEIKVSNFPETQKVLVEGLEKLKPKEVQKVRLDKEIKFPESVKLVEINRLIEESKKTQELLKRVIEKGVKSYIMERDDPKNPVAVRLSDGKKFYKAVERIEGIIKASGNALSGFATETTLNEIKLQTDKLAFDGSNRLKVYDYAGGGGGSVPDATNQYGTASNVAPSATGTVVNYTAVSGYKIRGWIVTGEADARVYISINGTVKYVGRLSIAKKQSVLTLPNPDAVSLDDVVKLEVVNEGDATASFEGTLLGE